MAAILLNGTQLSQKRKEIIKRKIDELIVAGRRRPKLAVLLVGDDPASHVYVGHKERACMSVGITSETLRLPASITEREVLDLVHKLNEDPGVDGILPQLPLPAQIERIKVIAAISARKDVDGLTFANQGLLQWNLPGLAPCTPAGVMALLEDYQIPLEGKLCAVLGRSILVGAPVCTMMSHAGSTVIMLHKKSMNTKEHVKQADIVIAATGVKHLVKRDWIKEGAVVVDVGIHRESNGKLTGDVDFEGVKDIASYITPVPGGVGPMTIAMLLENCFTAYERRENY